MKLITTIDTEEDNWAHYSTTDNPVENIERIIHLQKIFDEYKVKPTYLVSYPVATNQRSVEILKKILDQGRCEIGMHCHPWNTPPFDKNKNISPYETMLCNLDPSSQKAKLEALHEAIQNNFGIRPVSFRAGRYGFGSSVAKTLIHLGYSIDTSVTPFVSWTNYHGPDFSEFRPEPFWFSSLGVEHIEENGALLELPVTIGFLQNDFEASHRRLTILQRPLARRLHFAGILERLRLLNKVWLSPEITRADDMIKLARKMKEKNFPFINLTFHSTSLKSGLSPFVQAPEDEVEFLRRIRAFLDYSYNSGWESQTLSELADYMKI